MATRITRNLDLHLTILAAVALGIAGVLDLATPSVLAGATLTTLGVLAMGSLAGRTELRSLTRTAAELTAVTQEHLTGRTGADRLLEVSGAGLDLDDAADIRIVGVTLARTLRNHVGTLQSRLRAGATIHIALIDPDGDAVGEAARRSLVADSPEIFTHRLHSTFDLLRRLAVTTGSTGRLEVRVLGFVPSFGLVAVDPGLARGRLHVDIYAHGAGGPEPAMVLHAERDHTWYRHFAGEFDRIWAAGQPPGRHL